jgi:tRNA G18 (ribose-2'-O)-methylase SpoU
VPTFIDSLADPRLLAYRNLKDKELARDGRRFIAEGEQVVRRLIASGIEVESVLLAQRKAAGICPLVPASVPVWLASDETIEQVIGYEFHSGVMACGIRPRAGTLEGLLGKPKDSSRSSSTLVVCPKITNVENLGVLIRIAAAFGVAGLLLGEQCCDPYFRQSVRVSMGSVFSLPMARSESIEADLRRLKTEWGMELVATVLATDAQPLAEAGRTANMAIFFGGEADGLDPAHTALCDRRVTIPMRRGTDSLNVSVAAGIVLYHFMDICKLPR